MSDEPLTVYCNGKPYTFPEDRTTDEILIVRMHEAFNAINLPPLPFEESSEKYKINDATYNEDSILHAYYLTSKDICIIKNEAGARNDNNMLAAINALESIKSFAKSLKENNFSDEERHHIASLCHEYC